MRWDGMVEDGRWLREKASRGGLIWFKASEVGQVREVH